MAVVSRIEGPDPKGNYKAHLSDGTVMTCGQCRDKRWEDKNNPDRYWFVSIDTGDKSYTTFIVEADPGIAETQGMAQLRAIKAKGNDKKYWELIAVAVLGSNS